MTQKQAQFLMANGRTEKMKGFTSKAGKKFEARLKFDDNFKVVFGFDDGPRNGAAMPQPRSVPARPLREGRAPAARKSSPPYAGDLGPLPEEGMPYPEEQGPPVYGDDPGPVSRRAGRVLLPLPVPVLRILPHAPRARRKVDRAP